MKYFFFIFVKVKSFFAEIFRLRLKLDFFGVKKFGKRYYSVKMDQFMDESYLRDFILFGKME